MTTKVGTRKVMRCKATGQPVVMEYEGLAKCPRSYAMESNGHPGWLCLHNDEVEDDIKEAEAFETEQSRH